jgi:chorismate mutase/prephenate dehydratase
MLYACGGEDDNAIHNAMNDDEIRRRRSAIDAIDIELVRLLNQRAEEARAIGVLKGGAPAYRPEREAQVISAAQAAGEGGPLSAAALGRIFVEIISACRDLERLTRVGYLGPAGTFSETAVGRHFGAGVDAVPLPSIDAAFRSTETGEIDFSVVPVENSTEGAVPRTLDLLLQTPLKICGEVVLHVHQNLMGRTAVLDQIERVYSHPQSLAQCHAWLSQNVPRAARIAVSSNAEAARLAAEEGAAAAIGPLLAAERYGLPVLAVNVEENPRNLTRFLVLGTTDAAPSGKDRTSLVMSAHNRPGAVHALLTPFKEEGVSMTRIESRPARTGQWEYFFFVDLDGHRGDPAVARALARLSELAPFLKVFGSYPAARP